MSADVSRDANRNNRMLERMSSDTLLDGHMYVFLGIHGRYYLCNHKFHRTVQNVLS